MAITVEEVAGDTVIGLGGMVGRQRGGGRQAEIAIGSRTHNQTCKHTGIPMDVSMGTR